MEPPLPLTAHDIERTLRPRRQASQLPPRAFTDPAIHAWELEHLFRRGWIGACHADQVRERGQYVMVELGPESAFVVADDDGIPRAFVNTCRHRGARIVDGREGRVRRLQCRYHAWSYGLDGTLHNAPFTGDLEDFDPASFGLKPVRLAVVEGLVLLDLSGEAPPPAEHVGDLKQHLAHHRVGDLRRAARIVYDVGANWKAIAENYSECLHCPGVHPELNRLSHYLSGAPVTGAGAWCGGSMTLSDDAHTMGTGGGTAGRRPPIAGLTETDLRSVYYYLVFPNVLVSLHPDYVMLHTLWPRAADRTEVVCEWFFEPATIAAEAFDPADAVDFWDQVNREDWEICALTQRGLSNRDAEAGRYTSREDDVHAFDVMVAERYLRAAVPSKSAQTSP